MSLKLSKREIILLVVLAVVILVVGYIKVYYEPLQSKIDAINSKTMDEQTQIDTNTVLAAQIQKMKQQITEIKGSSDFKELPAYDNSFALTNELYAILASVKDYSITFGEVTEADSIVSKAVTLSFETGTYAEARAVIDNIAASQFAVEIGNISIQGGSTSSDGTASYVTGVALTYYEAANQ